MSFKKGLVAVVAGLGFFVASSTVSEAREYNPHSIVDYLAEKGEDYSFANRAVLAETNGIANYKGTAEQNVTLLSLLQGEKVAITTSTYQESQPAEKKEESAEPKQTQTEAKPAGKVLEMTATAYTAYCTGCSGVTATGIDLRSNPNQKVVAVDPSVIPLGSRVHVEGYGEAIAGDTGGAIKGNKIDLFIPNQADAINFGRRTVKVTVLD